MTSPFDYLQVDRYLRTPLEARALDYALSSGLIDRLREGPCALQELPIRTEFGKQLVLDVLERAAVICRKENQISLDPSFRALLPLRDLIESKIEFCDHVARDIAQHFASLVDDLPSFMANSHTFDLFRYDRCLEVTSANVAATRRWVRYTTALTRHEGRVLASLLDLAGARRLLDVGGNSGELARQLCLAYPELRVTVADLPVVCALGRENVAELVDADRVVFQACDMRREPLPCSFEVVTLKSVLHDWPAADARALIQRAARCCEPGGRIVIFERASMPIAAAQSYAQLPNLVFAPFYREAGLYLDALRGLGCPEIETRRVELDIGFHLIVARMPGLRT